MEPIKAEKLRAVKSYRKQSCKSHQFFYSLIVHSLIAVTCSLLCSYSYWFPSLYTIKHLLFMSLPNSCSGFFNPGCLFIVVNFIVVFLIGESRLSGTQSSPATEMYNEYVERSRSLRRPLSALQEKKEERIVVVPLVNPNEDNAKISEDKEDKYDDDHEEHFEECDGNDEEEYEKKEEEEVKAEENEEEVKADQENEEEGKAEEKEETGLIPAEELNKRVEDFIARVNKQRWLEARVLVCSRA